MKNHNSTTKTKFRFCKRIYHAGKFLQTIKNRTFSVCLSLPADLSRAAMLESSELTDDSFRSRDPSTNMKFENW